MNSDDGLRAPEHSESAGIAHAAGEPPVARYAAGVRRSRAVRLPAAVLFLSCGAILAVAVYLKPDPHGMGTHQQLGLAPCGMVIMTGYPCPTCGMTTAFAHTVRGQFFEALRSQAGGFALALLTIAVAVGALWALLSGRPPRIAWHVITPYRLLLAMLLILLGGWFVKIAIGWFDGSIPVATADRRW